MKQATGDTKVSPIVAVVLGTVIVVLIGVAYWWWGDGGGVRYQNEANKDKIIEIEARKMGFVKGPDGKWAPAGKVSPLGGGVQPNSTTTTQ